MVMLKGIKQKTITVFLVILISVISMSLMISIYRGFKLTGTVLGKRALKAASQVHIDGDKLEGIIKRGNSNSAEYLDIQRQLAFYLKVLDLKYLYTMTRNNKGEYVYVVDGTDMKSEEFSKLGQVETDTGYYGIYNLVMSGQVVNNDFTMDDKWGQLVSAYIPIENSDGKVIGFLGADINASEMLSVVKSNLLTTVLAIVIVLLVGVFAILFFARKLTDPIVQLRDYSLKVMNGEDVGPFEKVIKDEVGQLAAVLNNRIDSIRNILDNTGEGLLTFGSSLRINREYSNECVRIFNNKKFENLNVAELIFPNSDEERSFMEKNLNKIFSEKDSTRRNAYLSLLSHETVIGGRNIKLKYKIISDVATGNDIIMVILRDITDKKVLEKTIENERNTLDSIVKIMVNLNEFSCLVNNYHVFTSIEIWEMLESEKPANDVLYDVYSKIHTFKGDFSIYGTNHIVKRLHMLEQELSLLHNELSKVDSIKLKEYFYKQNLVSWLDEDMDQLAQIIGGKLVDEIVGNGGVVTVDDVKIERLEQYIIETLQGEERDHMLAQFKKLWYKPLNGMMRLYPDYIEQLANRLNKDVGRLEITGGDFLIDEGKYKNFIATLIHVFRNSIDHGIEDAESRNLHNKPEAGSIKCDIQLVDTLLNITMSDDGSGIDIEKLKKTAIEKCFKTAEQLCHMSEDEIINMIFIEEFSTKESITELSGRGIGLPAFKKELEKIGGSVVVKSTTGVGTSFIITIPDVDAELVS